MTEGERMVWAAAFVRAEETARRINLDGGMLDGYKVTQACEAVRRLRAVDIGDTSDPDSPWNESIRMLRDMVGTPDPAKCEPAIYQVDSSPDDGLVDALESIGANPAKATLNEIVEAMNKVNLCPGFYVASEDGRSYSAIPNAVGTSHVEIVPWSHEGKTREELVERIEFLDSIIDDEDELNDCKADLERERERNRGWEEWFTATRFHYPGGLHAVGGRASCSWEHLGSRIPWPTREEERLAAASCENDDVD